VVSVTRAEYLRGYIKAWRAARRAELIEMLGGRCVRCGAVEDLEFDHIDPTTKRFAVGANGSLLTSDPGSRYARE
jgi:5-methylcytosine-specific restriction endonuclease McrA